jgi:signal transduction histidine kinase
MVEIQEEEFLELERQAELGRLLANVAHEFSVPAGAILANRDTGQRLLGRIEQAVAESAIGRIGELMASLRDLARMDQLAAERIGQLVRSLKVAARAGDSEPRRSNLNDIVESAVQLAKIQFKDRVAVETMLGALPEVECHPHLLSQAILNLVTNAGQAIEGAGKVTVGTEAASDAAHIWVADTGRGIREEDKPKVLKQRFTTKPIGTGTGLGLMMVQQAIIERHGGSISFESEWGRGTTFHIRIPLERKKKGVT